ncbi:MAG: SMP-30/gluconolactonase/LRE family protein [Candidatus Poribacteria bacterium]|nr:SMP-30/gluconolactonase/LRE family protein [Candidatus Poribacteria bacterium]MDE0324351.1 SMP-30/gluconolactonase/LRE family protein [Candidatus Poribacteria bacterium]
MSNLNVSQTIVCAVTAGFALAPALIGNTADSNSIFAPDAELKELFNGAHFTEGVSVAPDGTVYFSDITFTDQTDMQAGNIWKHNPETGETTIFRSPSGMSNGTKFDAHGRLVVAEGADFGGRRITRTDMKTGKSEIIAGLYNGKPFNSPNDLSIDEQGRIYFTDPRYAGNEPVEQPIFGVYRIDPDRSVHLVVTDAGKPNGVAVSPDQQTLYVISHDNGAMGSFPDDVPLLNGRMALLAYDLSPKGTATFRKVLVDYAPQDGPDGMVVDAEGNLFVAVRDETRPGVRVYTPEGEELAYVKTPDKPTNVAFGRGKTSKTLYITAENCLYSIQTMKEGYHLPQK